MTLSDLLLYKKADPIVVLTKCRSICWLRSFDMHFADRFADSAVFQINSADYAIFDCILQLTMCFSNRFFQADHFLFLTQMPLHNIHHIPLASFPGRFFYNRTKLKNTAWYWLYLGVTGTGNKSSDSSHLFPALQKVYVEPFYSRKSNVAPCMLSSIKI